MTAGIKDAIQGASVVCVAGALLVGATSSVQAGTVVGGSAAADAEVAEPAESPAATAFPAESMADAAQKAKQMEIQAAKRARQRAQRSSGPMFTPTRNFHYSATFGQAGGWSSGHHTGLDFAAPAGTPVFAALAGKVLASDGGGPYGNHVIVRHDNGVKTLYAHLTTKKVEPGDRVLRGQIIGTVGSTGNSTGPHLHFEVIKNGTQRDPSDFL